MRKPVVLPHGTHPMVFANSELMVEPPSPVSKRNSPGCPLTSACIVNSDPRYGSSLIVVGFEDLVPASISGAIHRNNKHTIIFHIVFMLTWFMGLYRYLKYCVKAARLCPHGRLGFQPRRVSGRWRRRRPLCGWRSGGRREGY